MRFPDESYNLRIELDTHNCEFSPEEIEQFEEGLKPLRGPVEKFPVSDLYITITFQPRSNVYRVKTALVLTGRTLAAGDLDEQAYPAFKRCVRKLVRRLDSYEAELSEEEERVKHEKGTHQEVLPVQEPDAELLQKAFDDQNYQEFREAMYVYEEPLRKRIGRWVGRYPDIEAQIGDELKIADVVEEVFLNAWERWGERPQEVPVSAWLEQLIDPSLRLLAENPEEELENIEFIRSTEDLG